MGDESITLDEVARALAESWGYTALLNEPPIRERMITALESNELNYNADTIALLRSMIQAMLDDAWQAYDALKERGVIMSLATAQSVTE